MQPYDWQILADLVESHMLSEAKRRTAQLERARLTSSPIRESESRFIARMTVLSELLKKVRSNVS